MKRRRRKTEAISHATFLSIYGKRGFAKKICRGNCLRSLRIPWPDERHSLTLHLIIPGLREVAYELLPVSKDLKRPFKCPRGADLIAAYETCASFPAYLQ